MIVTVGSTKGGVGKTTLACNLTVALAKSGQDVLLIDGDEQRTAIAFSELRGQHPDAPSFSIVALYGGAIRTQMRQLVPRYKHIIIDVAGRESHSLRAALQVSDLVIIPTQPRSFDLWGVDQTVEMVRDARASHDLRAIAVLMGADAQGSDNQDSLEALREIEDIEVSEHVLVRRKAYPNAAAKGLGVLEYTDNAYPQGSLRAREDFQAFYQSIFPAPTAKRRTA